MRIGIDARWIFPQVSGIGTYTRELIRELAALDRQNEYVLFFQDARIADDVTGAARLSDAPNFSTLVLFAQEEMTTETLRDNNNRRTTGRVVENVGANMVAPASGVLFTNAA